MQFDIQSKASVVFNFQWKEDVHGLSGSKAEATEKCLWGLNISPCTSLICMLLNTSGRYIDAMHFMSFLSPLQISMFEDVKR